MSTKIKTAFRPAVEAVEGRILARAGLIAAESHGQSWVEIANQSGRNLAYEISFNEGRTYSTLTVRKGHTAFAHVNQAVPEVLIGLRGGAATELAPGSSKQTAALFVTSPTATGKTTVAPAPVLVGGGNTSVGTAAGNAEFKPNTGKTDTLPQTYVVLLNQSGRNVTLAFTNNNGWNYLDLTVGQQYYSLYDPYFVSLDQTNAGIAIQRPNGGGLQRLASSPSLNSAPIYIIDANLNVFRS